MTPRDVVFALRELVARQPFLYATALNLLRSPRRHLIVTRKSHIVVDGFPRSGNTFTVCALMGAASEPIRIARHIHLPVQFELAARYRIPAALLLRDPLDAAVSLLLREPRLSASYVLRYYERFYISLRPLREHLVAIHFETLIRDPFEVYRRVNRRFGTAFPTPPFDQEIHATIRELVGAMAMHDREGRVNPIAGAGIPDARRDSMKESVRDRVLEECPSRWIELACQAYRSWDRDTGENPAAPVPCPSKEAAPE